jgi:hypothetical protein
MRESAAEEGVCSWRTRLERRATALGAEWSNGDEEEDEESRRRDRILLKAGATSLLVDDMVDGGGGGTGRREAAVYSPGSGGELYLPCSAASAAVAGWYDSAVCRMGWASLPSFLTAAKVIWV